jgi:hypothetical protein
MRLRRTTQGSFGGESQGGHFAVIRCTLDVDVVVFHAFMTVCGRVSVSPMEK